MPAKGAPPLSDAARGTVQPRDDMRPPGAPHAGIAPGQLDPDAVAAATVDGAGEPLPPLDKRAEQGAFADAPDESDPQPPSPAQAYGEGQSVFPGRR